MPEPQYALKPKKEEKSIEETINQLKSNGAEEYVNIPELIFNGFEYIDDIKKEANNKENQMLIFKKFIMEYNKIINYMNSLDETSDEIEAFKQLVKESSEKIEQLLSGNLEINEIEEVLSNVLTKTSEHYTKIIETQKENYSNKNKTEINLPEEQKEDFIIPEINAAYEKLYEATLKNDIKKITLYRGRVIKLLQKNKTEIEKKYNEVECLDRLEQLVTSNAYSKEKVVEILSEEKNKKYKEKLLPYLNNTEKFIGKVLELYEKKSVKKVKTYKESLKKEIKEQKRFLEERYSKEFLDKKGTLTGLVTVLPKAVGLSIKKLSTAISELKEAKTSRRKINSALNVAKKTGELIATPAIYAGKLVADNWYALYALYKGYSKYKEQEETTSELEKQEEELKHKEEELKHKEAQVKSEADRMSKQNKMINDIERQKAAAYAEKMKLKEAMEKSAEQANKSKELESIPESQRLMQDSKEYQEREATEPVKETEPEKNTNEHEDSSGNIDADIAYNDYVHLPVINDLGNAFNEFIYKKYCPEDQQIEREGFDLGGKYRSETSDFTREFFTDKIDDLLPFGENLNPDISSIIQAPDDLIKNKIKL